VRTQRTDRQMGMINKNMQRTSSHHHNVKPLHSLLPHTCHMPCPSHLGLVAQLVECTNHAAPNYLYFFSPCYFLPQMSDCLHQQPALEHSPPVFCNETNFDTHTRTGKIIVLCEFFFFFFKLS